MENDLQKIEEVDDESQSKHESYRYPRLSKYLEDSGVGDESFKPSFNGSLDQNLYSVWSDNAIDTCQHHKVNIDKSINHHFGGGYSIHNSNVRRRKSLFRKSLDDGGLKFHSDVECDDYLETEERGILDTERETEKLNPTKENKIKNEIEKNKNLSSVHDVGFSSKKIGNNVIIRDIQAEKNVYGKDGNISEQIALPSNSSGFIKVSKELKKSDKIIEIKKDTSFRGNDSETNSKNSDNKNAKSSPIVPTKDNLVKNLPNNRPMETPKPMSQQNKDTSKTNPSSLQGLTLRTKSSYLDKENMNFLSFQAVKEHQQPISKFKIEGESNEPNNKKLMPMENSVTPYHIHTNPQQDAIKTEKVKKNLKPYFTKLSNLSQKQGQPLSLPDTNFNDLNKMVKNEPSAPHTPAKSGMEEDSHRPEKVVTVPQRIPLQENIENISESELIDDDECRTPVKPTLPSKGLKYLTMLSTEKRTSRFKGNTIKKKAQKSKGKVNLVTCFLPD